MNPASPQQFANLGSVASNVKSGPARLFSLHATNRNAALRWLQVFNSVDESVLLYQWPLPPGNSQIVIGNDFFQAWGWAFGTALTVGVSTTSGSYVAATPSDHDFGGSYC